MEPESESEPWARRQFRHRRRPALLQRMNPTAADVLRARYLQPIIPLAMHAIPLTAHDGHTFGLVGTVDMIGYASHVAVGVPWFTTQGPYLASISPPLPTDPLHLRQYQRQYQRDYRLRHGGTDGSRMVPTWAARIKTKPKERRPFIRLLDRLELRRKYLEIAERYLSGKFRGFHPPKPPIKNFSETVGAVL